MAEGKLHLTVLDVDGHPIDERADVMLKNQTLSDAPVYRDVDFATTRLISDLNVFPNGTYRLEVDTLSYHPVSRFVNIPPDGNRSVTITLPVNPKKVVRVQFPTFDAPEIPADAWKLLRTSSNVLNFSGKSGKDLYDSLDDIRKAAFLNLVAKANRTCFAFQQESPRSVLSFILALSELRGDRFFAIVPRELRAATIHSVQQGLFHEVNESLHTPPPGFSIDRSFKTFDPLRQPAAFLLLKSKRERCPRHGH